MHGHAIAHRVVFGDRGVHLHLVLAHLGAVVGRLAHEIGLGEARRDIAQLEIDVALEIARLLGVDQRGIGRHGVARGKVGRQLAHPQLDEADRLVRGRLVDGRHGSHGLTLVAHLVARQRVLAAGDGQHAEGLVAVRAGDDGEHAGQPGGLGDVDLEDLGVRIGAAIDAARQHVGLQHVGGVLGAAGDLLGPIHHRHIGADGMNWRDLVHGVVP